MNTARYGSRRYALCIGMKWHVVGINVCISSLSRYAYDFSKGGRVTFVSDKWHVLGLQTSSRATIVYPNHSQLARSDTIELQHAQQEDGADRGAEEIEDDEPAIEKQQRTPPLSGGTGKGGTIKFRRSSE